VFAAASLTDAFAELAKTFEDRNPGTKVVASFESSSTLLTQIRQGVPADAKTSAAEEEINAAVDEGLVTDEPEVFARNREVILLPEANPANIWGVRDLARPGVRLVPAEEWVPAADYAVEILGQADVRYGDGFERDLLSNVASREADVRAAVNRVALGYADATSGYASDYAPDIREQVEIIEIPQDLNIVATYPIAVLKDTDRLDLARDWVDLVTGVEGQRTLEKWGFEPAA
jgi:molybdate transport system substrate-binding protein